MIEQYFNVFDGKKIHVLKAEQLNDFIVNSNNNLTISKESVETKKICGRIRMTRAKKTFLVKNKKEKLVAIDTKNNKTYFYKNIAECSKALNIDDSNISKVLKNKRKTAGGYIFKFV